MSSGSWTNVRWTPEGFEMRCDYCARAKQGAWWPLTHEFWDTNRAMTRCRACWNAYYRDRRSRSIARQWPIDLAEKMARRRAYNREWMARKRAVA